MLVVQWLFQAGKHQDHIAGKFSFPIFCTNNFTEVEDHLTTLANRTTRLGKTKSFNTEVISKGPPNKQFRCLIKKNLQASPIFIFQEYYNENPLEVYSKVTNPELAANLVENSRQVRPFDISELHSSESSI